MPLPCGGVLFRQAMVPGSDEQSLDLYVPLVTERGQGTDMWMEGARRISGALP
jgi:hypothetical protein